MRTHRLLLTGTILAGGLAAAASAAGSPASPHVTRVMQVRSAQTVTAGKLAACYTAGHNYHASQHLQLRGGTPGDTYLLGAAFTTDGHQVSDLGGISRFNAEGRSRASLSAFSPPGDPTDAATPGTRVRLSVKELTSGGARTEPLGTTTVTVEALTVNFTSPASSDATREVAVSGTRFAHQQLYGFVTAVGSTQVLRSFDLGSANACGYVQHAEDVSPTTLTPGNFQLYVNAGPTLNPATALSQKFTVSTAS